MNYGIIELRSLEKNFQNFPTFKMTLIFGVLVGSYEHFFNKFNLTISRKD
jgi:hypothetical protein